ncbi:Glutathione S-transferase GST-4.5 [Curvularia clavata]|uniref:Glutathione S-transferase GST-4.5 n=1 Tax=Curvularia clavata TaxID=95742 RepID=A0A9Q9DR41_CURCL|nr:Glutathione S-transferase GST-4.5 [Curvularia clavata]
MSPKLHLYHTPGSCSLATHIALNSASLEFDATNISAARGFPASHLHLNPKGRVPILEIDGELITETPALLATISALAPEKHLLGEGVMNQARAYEWMTWLSGTMHGQAFGCVFRPARFIKDETMYDVLRESGRNQAKECFEYVEKKLEGRNWAVGDTFTLVDAYLLVFYRWGNMLKMEMRDNYPNYARLVDAVTKREDVQKTIASEGISTLNE